MKKIHTELTIKVGRRRPSTSGHIFRMKLTEKLTEISGFIFLFRVQGYSKDGSIFYAEWSWPLELVISLQKIKEPAQVEFGSTRMKTKGVRIEMIRRSRRKFLLS